jgi:UDP-N-acetylglucosamine--N-acetylmuramyl-(pentapeptide) pyrophosphoryl-undecaprenol N-acetylglucosamine transferase
VTAVGLPAIFVPLPIGNGEQRFNAEPVVEAGGGVLVADDLMTPAALLDAAVPLLTDPGRLDAMATSAATFGRTDADTVLAEMVRDAAASRR